MREKLAGFAAQPGRFLFLVPGLVFLALLLATLSLCSRVIARIFHLAPGILNFAFRLFRDSAYLLFRVTRPLANLAFDPARDVFNFAFCAIFVHKDLLD